MNAANSEPPPVIDSARTLWYALNDETVRFTDRISLFVGDVGDLSKLDEMPHLAICENFCAPGEILLFFCNEDWQPQGTVALDSVKAAKQKAEVGYTGISAKWAQASSSDNEVDEYLRDVYDVDPSTEWWRLKCAFCGKDDSELDRLFGSPKAYICDGCIRSLYRTIADD
ncbi:MAG: ClpX C4-type zinc finger protein [Wenzhouxiangellaceae bacterium]